MLKKLRYYWMKEVAAPTMMGVARLLRPRRPRKPHLFLEPRLKCTARLRRIMQRHYFLARYARDIGPVAWVSTAAPVELLRVFDCYTIYPQNHTALCSICKLGPAMCAAAEEQGYSADLCSSGRVNLGHYFTGQSPVGQLPKPDLIFCANNICQVATYWYKALAHYWRVPLFFFDAPYNFQDIQNADITYMAGQLEDMVPLLERVCRRAFSKERLQQAIRLARETATSWQRILQTLKAIPAPLNILDAFRHLGPIVNLRGLPVAHEYYQLLLTELEQRVQKGIGAIKRERKRLLWDNIAIWYKLREFVNLFAKHGLNFVSATYTHAWTGLAQHLDENQPWESMARAYSLIMLNCNLKQRLNSLEELIREFHIDGVLMHSAHSCKPYSLGQYDLKQWLTQRLDIPVLIIEADPTDARRYDEAKIQAQFIDFWEKLEVL